MQAMKTERPVMINFRVPRKLHRAFFRKAASAGVIASDVIRELMLAYTEGRVVVTPMSVTQPSEKET